MTDLAQKTNEIPTSCDDEETTVAQLFAMHRDKLLRAIQLRLDPRVSSKVDREDVLQDVFIEATRRLPEFRDRPAVPVFVWLRQLTLQKIVDTHRRHLGAKMRSVSQEVPLYQAAAHSSSSALLAVQLADSLTSPSACAVREEMLQGLRDALAGLREADREVLILRHLEDLSNNEVAQVLEIDRFAASKRYLRALERLRDALPLGQEEMATR